MNPRKDVDSAALTALVDRLPLLRTKGGTLPNCVDEARTVCISLPKVRMTLTEPVVVAFKLERVLGPSTEICRSPESCATSWASAVDDVSKRRDIMT